MLRAQRAPVYIGWLPKDSGGGCGLFVDTDVLPAGFELGKLSPGTVRLQSDTDKVLSEHYTMKVDGVLCTGMHAISTISDNSRNPMQLINSSCSNFNSGIPKVANAVVSKHEQAVTLTHDVRQGKQILLRYQQTANLVLTTSPSQTHPQPEGAHLYFIVPPEEHPLPLKSVSLSLAQKQDLIRTLSISSMPRLTKEYSMTTDQKQRLLNSVYQDLFASSDDSVGSSLQRAASDVTVVAGSLKREASDVTVVASVTSSFSNTVIRHMFPGIVKNIFCLKQSTFLDSGS
eukprot:g2175.t1